MTELDQGRSPNKLSHRLLIALLVGLLVWGLTLIVAWRSTSKSLGLRPEQWATQNLLLPGINQAIMHYQQETGSAPLSLTDLENDQNRKFLADGWMDHWGNPLTSSVEGNTLLVTSYGRDGKPGGRGLDHDLTSANPNPYAAIPTFKQFLFEMPSGGIHWWCVVNGAMVFTFALIVSNKPETKRLSAIGTILNVVILIITAVIVGGIIAGLHVPTGH